MSLTFDGRGNARAPYVNAAENEEPPPLGPPWEKRESDVDTDIATDVITGSEEKIDNGMEGYHCMLSCHAALPQEVS